MPKRTETITSAKQRWIGRQLALASDLLEQQAADRFRIRAYRRAAEFVATDDVDVVARWREDGLPGLIALPAIGLGIASAIDEMLRTSHWRLLDRLRGTADPERLFRTVPGIGPTLAHLIHERLDIDSLEALEIAAHDGRLEAIPGFGKRRSAAVRAGLAALLRQRRTPVKRSQPSEPDVRLLLDIDRVYRERAADGNLPTIAPRRFNPDHRSWLPVLHARRGPWHFTALFSNTALAHRLQRTNDWVVLFFDDGEQHESQATVVTETQGSLAGLRVVRGREAECRTHYASLPTERQGPTNALGPPTGHSIQS